MNILLCLNKKFLGLMVSLLNSILDSNQDNLDVYVVAKDLNENDLNEVNNNLFRKVKFYLVKFDDSFLIDAPVCERYPKEIYYRIFAAKILPSHLNRILYLDCDIIVKGSLKDLYNMDFNGNLYVGTSNVRKILKRFNQIKNNASKESEYLNTGVLLMNLELLRKEQNLDDVFNYIKERNKFFTLPDQDIISTLYGDRVILVNNLIYNISDRAIIKHNIIEHDLFIDEKWVEDNTVIIHYYGKNKPWKEDYHGILKKYYDKYKFDFN